MLDLELGFYLFGGLPLDRSREDPFDKGEEIFGIIGICKVIVSIAVKDVEKVREIGGPGEDQDGIKRSLSSLICRAHVVCLGKRERITDQEVGFSPMQGFDEGRGIIKKGYPVTLLFRLPPAQEPLSESRRERKYQ